MYIYIYMQLKSFIKMTHHNETKGFLRGKKHTETKTWLKNRERVEGIEIRAKLRLFVK